VNTFFESSTNSALILSFGINIFCALIINVPESKGWQTVFRLKLPKWLVSMLFVVPYNKKLPPYLVISQIVNYMIMIVYTLLTNRLGVDCDATFIKIVLLASGLLYALLFIDLLLYSILHF
jgi:hypothetical protein